MRCSGVLSSCLVTGPIRVSVPFRGCRGNLPLDRGAMLTEEVAVSRSVRAGSLRCSGPGVPPQLEEVVGGADQLPFDVACAQAASSKPPDLADLLDVAEHRLDSVGPLGVERSPSFSRKLALHDPSAASREHASARDFATA